MNLFVDLFAGLGGASQAFVECGSWDVIQIDNNPDLIEHNPNLIMMDCLDTLAITELITEAIHDGDYEQVVVWASPPCLDFSLAFDAPGPRAQRAGEPFEPSLTAMLSAHRVICNVATVVRDDDAKFTWVIENVRGAVSWFTPHIGPPRGNWAKFFLWGNFPQLAFADRSIDGHVMEDKRHSPIRANIRAKVPMALSKALRDALTKQRSLTEWFSH